MPEAAAVEAIAAGADIWTVGVPAIAGLAGVVVGGLIQSLSAFLVTSVERMHRLADQQDQRDRENAKLEAERSYVRAVLARHLEAYARACAGSMWDNDNRMKQGATATPAFPDWPDVAWELLGANEMMKARDIEVRVEIRRDLIDVNIDYAASNEDDAREYLRDGASRIGLDAWHLARQMRIEAGAEPLEFPPVGGNFAESLENHVQMLDERARLFRERRDRGPTQD